MGIRNGVQIEHVQGVLVLGLQPSNIPRNQLIVSLALIITCHQLIKLSGILIHRFRTLPQILEPLIHHPRVVMAQESLMEMLIQFVLRLNLSLSHLCMVLNQA